MARVMSRVLDDGVTSDEGRMAVGRTTLFNSLTAGRRGWGPRGSIGEEIQTRRHMASVPRTLDDRSGFDGIIGRSASITAAVDGARKVAATCTTVLLTGENGTGKEVLARAIHRASARAQGRSSP